MSRNDMAPHLLFHRWGAKIHEAQHKEREKHVTHRQQMESAGLHDPALAHAATAHERKAK